MLQTKQKRGPGVENPNPRSFCCGIYPLTDSKRKGRCIRRHDTSATTPAATADATGVGRAHMIMIISLNSLPHTPPPFHTHAHTQIYMASIRGRCIMNMTVYCLISTTSLLAGVCISEFLCVYVCVGLCVYVLVCFGLIELIGSFG